jgi:hypothetical protein
MKYKGHIATGNYEFLEVELEAETPQEAVEAYKAMQRAYQTGGGLPEPQWRALLDEFLSTGKVANGGDFWEELDDRQRWMCNEIKKSIKRRNND